MKSLKWWLIQTDAPQNEEVMIPKVLGVLTKNGVVMIGSLFSAMNEKNVEYQINEFHHIKLHSVSCFSIAFI